MSQGRRSGLGSKVRAGTEGAAGDKHGGSRPPAGGVRRGASESDPTFVTDGQDFIGLLMPRRWSLDSVADPWDDILGGKPADDTKADAA